jgi:hypothetical protein
MNLVTPLVLWLNQVAPKSGWEKDSGWRRLSKSNPRTTPEEEEKVPSCEGHDANEGFLLLIPMTRFQRQTIIQWLEIGAPPPPAIVIEQAHCVRWYLLEPLANQSLWPRSVWNCQTLFCVFSLLVHNWEIFSSHSDLSLFMGEILIQYQCNQISSSDRQWTGVVVMKVSTRNSRKPIFMRLRKYKRTSEDLRKKVGRSSRR